MPLQELPAAAEAFAGFVSSSSSDAAGFGASVGTLLQALTEGRSLGLGPAGKGSSSTDSSSSRGGDVPAGKVAVKVADGPGSAMRRLLNTSKENLIAEERRLLQQVEALLQEVVPQVSCCAVCGGHHNALAFCPASSHLWHCHGASDGSVCLRCMLPQMFL
jgi:hypothetical protein